LREISLHILDIMQNSTAAQARVIKVVITVESGKSMLRIVIEDDGCGMDSKVLAKVTDPFTTGRTTRRVGLGIPLFKASAEQSGGDFAISSQKDVGTVVRARYEINSIDRPPIGDLPGVIADMAAGYPTVEIHLQLENGDRQFVFNSREVKQVLGDVPLSEFEVIVWLREYISEGLKEIFGGVLSEINS